MSKDFILISGHGIFPRSSILQVVPDVSEDYSINLTAPTLSVEEFVFSIVKTTEINILIHRAASNGKKDEVEKLVDNNYTRVMKESYDFSEAEILALLYDGKPDEKVLTAISNYKRRLKKFEEYQQRVAIVQRNPELPDFQASLASLAKDAPSPETAEKQTKSLTRIQESLQEKILEIIEASDTEADADADTVEHRMIELFETEEHSSDIETRVNDALSSFYFVNFDQQSGMFLNEVNSASKEPYIPSVEEVEGALDKADTIRDNPAVAVTNRDSVNQVGDLLNEESPTED